MTKKKSNKIKCLRIEYRTNYVMLIIIINKYNKLNKLLHYTTVNICINK